MAFETLQVPQETLASLEATLLNSSGSVPLHKRFRALFTLKALKNDDAVNIICKGVSWSRDVQDVGGDSTFGAGFADESALLKHELAYCLGQMKKTSALTVLESVLRNDQENAMVRHEVCPLGRSHRCFVLT